MLIYVLYTNVNTCTIYNTCNTNYIYKQVLDTQSLLFIPILVINRVARYPKDTS